MFDNKSLEVVGGYLGWWGNRSTYVSFGYISICRAIKLASGAWLMQLFISVRISPGPVCIDSAKMLPKTQSASFLKRLCRSKGSPIIQIT